MAAGAESGSLVSRGQARLSDGHVWKSKLDSPHVISPRSVATLAVDVWHRVGVGSPLANRIGIGGVADQAIAQLILNDWLAEIAKRGLGHDQMIDRYVPADLGVSGQTEFPVSPLVVPDDGSLAAMARADDVIDHCGEPAIFQESLDAPGPRFRPEAVLHTGISRIVNHFV
jgi:hypothetical protein